MKIVLFSILATLLSVSTSANTLDIARPGVSTIQGTVEVRVEHLMTCLAIGCPPATTRTVATVTDDSTGETLLIPSTEIKRSKEKVSVLVKGKSIVLQDGDEIQITGLRSKTQFLSISKLVILNKEELSTLLEIREETHAIGGTYRFIKIDESGLVTLTLKNASARTESTEEVAQLTAANLRKLNSLLQKASEGELVQLNIPTCRALTLATVTTTGFDGSVEISRFGYPCGARYENNTAAGKKLAEYAIKLWNEYRSN